MKKIAKIQTKTEIMWGGFTPDVLNKIEISMEEMSRNNFRVTYQIYDKIVKTTETDMGELIEGDGNYIEIIENVLFPIRDKILVVPTAQWDALYDATFQYIANPENGLSELSKLEQDSIRESVGLLIYIQTDLLPSGKCGYETEPTDWEIKK